MKKNLRKLQTARLTDTNIRLLILLFIFLTLSLIEPKVASFLNIVSMLNNLYFLGIASLGIMVVMITGNLDMSAMGVATFSGFLTLKLFTAIGYGGHIITMCIVSDILGACIACINPLLSRKFNLSGFVISIGMNLILLNFIFIFLESAWIQPNQYPVNLLKFNYTYLFSYNMKDGTKVALNVGFLILVIVAVSLWVLLNKTKLGRGIYALGGDPEAVERVGYNRHRIHMIAYAIFGMCMGIAGIVYFCNMEQAESNLLATKQLMVVSGAILGGCNMQEGKGTPMGVLIGVLLITLIQNNLVLIGVPTYFIKAAIGAMTLLSVLSTSLAEKRNHYLREKGSRV